MEVQIELVALRDLEWVCRTCENADPTGAKGGAACAQSIPRDTRPSFRLASTRPPASSAPPASGKRLTRRSADTAGQKVRDMKQLAHLPI